MKQRIVVIGMSTGGLAAIKELLQGMPRDFNAPVFVVWHMSEDALGLLPEVLSQYTTLAVKNAEDGEKVREATIYVAPPDRHLIIEDGVVRTTRGPKENRFRPAIDPLFRSAAQIYGPSVIGVILSGSLDDGTAGLFTIKQHGGVTMVQDPVDAEIPSMPISAIRNVDIDHRLGATELGIMIGRVAKGETATPPTIGEADQEKIRIEVGIATSEGAIELGVRSLGPPSSFACPDCHGVMLELRDGTLLRFRCHTGHAYTAESFLDIMTKNTEDYLWASVRSMEEVAMLVNRLGDELTNHGEREAAENYLTVAHETQKKADAVRDVIFRKDRPATVELPRPHDATRLAIN